jgi:hypothetical protein
MTTLRLSPADDLSEEDRATLETAARQLCTTPVQLHGIWAAQVHWPRYLEARTARRRGQTCRICSSPSAVPVT